MNETDIQKILMARYNHEYVLTNSYIFGWESDYFGMAKQSGYFYEIEIKISKSDFKNDFKNKTVKHLCLSNGHKDIISIPQKEAQRYIYPKGHIKLGYSPLKYKNNIIPNRFYYAVPEELVNKIIDLLPKYAGLLVIKNNYCEEIKNAPLLHKKKNLPLLMPILFKKYYYGYLGLINKVKSLETSLKTKEFYYQCEFEKNINQLTLKL